MKVKANSFLGTTISLLIGIIVALVFKVDIFTAISVEIFIFLIGYCSQNYSENVYFMCFMASFFIFLISGDYVGYLFDVHYYRQFSDESIKFSHLAICMSMLFLAVGYLLTPQKNEKVMDNEYGNKKNEIKYIYIRKASMLIYYVSIVALLIDSIYAIFYVFQNGYFSYYLSYESILPEIILQLGDFAPMTLCFFLATFPTKRQCRSPIIIYFIYMILKFFSGQRGIFVYNTIFLIGYFVYRNTHYNQEKEIWIKKKYLYLLAGAVPIFIIVLMAYGFIREGNEMQYESIGETIINFFVEIGSSSMCVKYVKMYESELTDFKLYSFGNLINYLKYSPLFSWFNGVNQVAPHTVEYALQGNSLDQILSYLSMESRFLGGEGVGSSFVAELYADFKYVGIAVGSMIYGIIFKKISQMKKSCWLHTTCQLYILLAIMKAPRGSYGVFVSEIVNVTFLVALILVKCLAQALENRYYMRNKKLQFKLSDM